MNVELLDLDELVAGADFVTLHVVKTPETIGLIGTRAAGQGQAGHPHRQRGPRRHHRRGRAGRRHPIGSRRRRRDRRVRRGAVHRLAAVRARPSVVVTPHLGASTDEAQDKAGDTIAEQVALALARRLRAVRGQRRAPARRPRRCARSSRWPSGWVSCSPALTEAAAARARPRVPGPARRLRHPDPHAVGAQGLLRSATTDEPVSYVNAPTDRRGAGHRGARDVDHHRAGLREPDHRPGRRSRRSPAPSSGSAGEPRIVMVDDHTVDVPPRRAHDRDPQRGPTAA